MYSELYVCLMLYSELYVCLMLYSELYVCLKLYSELYVCLMHVILYKFHIVTRTWKTMLRFIFWAGRILIRLLAVRLKICFFTGWLKWPVVLLNLMYGHIVNSKPVAPAELYYFCTFIPALGSAQRTIVTATLQDLITGHYYTLPASERCDPVRYGKSSPLKLKNRC